MAWLAVDKKCREYIHEEFPYRSMSYEEWWSYRDAIILPKGSIKKLIGRELTWEDEPVELKEKK